MLNNKGIDLSNEDNRYRIKELLNPYEYNIERNNSSIDESQKSIYKSICHSSRNIKAKK
jgi:hypothetical protein